MRRPNPVPSVYIWLDATGDKVAAGVTVRVRKAMSVKEANALIRDIQGACLRVTRELRLMKRREREGHKGVHRYRAQSLKKLKGR